MALIIYATLQQLDEWFDGLPVAPPDNPTGYLRAASILIARACNRQPYIDTPDDASAGALADATCAQIASWVTLGIDPDKAGTDMPGPVKSSKILDATVERDTTAATKLLTAAVEGLADQAEAILQQAGLLWTPVPLGADTTDTLPQWGQEHRTSPLADPLSGEYAWPYFSDWPTYE